MTIPDYATYRGILNDFSKQFDKLRQIVSGVKKYYWTSSTEEYLGPINPTGIIFTYGTRENRETGELVDNCRHWLVLAENIPPEFADPEARGPMIILTPLDAHFNIQGYDNSSKSITEVFHDYDATIESWYHRDPFNIIVWNGKLSLEEKLRWRENN